MTLFDISSEATVGHLNLAASPFVLLALAFVGKKAYQLMRLPILGSDNYRFFGLVFYGGSILANVVLSIVGSSLGVSDDDETHKFVLGITSSCAFFGTHVFLLDSKRGKDHCNAQLEDRYPSTVYFVRSDDGFIAANWCSGVAFVLNFGMMIAYLKDGDTSHGYNYTTNMAIGEFVVTLVTTISLSLLCMVAFYPSYRDAISLKERSVARIMLQIICGFVVLAMGSFCSSILKLVWSLEESSDMRLKVALYISDAVMMAGSLILVIANWPVDGTPSKVVVLQPSTWENAYHPCNYVLLSAVWMFIGTAFKLASYHSIASLCIAWAFLVLTLHFHMAYYVFESMTLVPEDDSNENLSEKVTFRSDDGILGNQLPHQDCDVLISGGGISGLFLACILGKEKVNVIVCEFLHVRCCCCL